MDTKLAQSQRHADLRADQNSVSGQACTSSVQPSAPTDLWDAEMAIRRAEAHQVSMLVDYVQSFCRTRAEDRERRYQDLISLGMDQSASALKKQEHREARTDESAALLYAARAMRTSEYRASALFSASCHARTALPNVWQAFLSGKITSTALSRISRTSRDRLCDKSSRADLDALAPEYAEHHRPRELERWLTRFTAVAEPENAADRCQRELDQRTVSVRPADDFENMSWFSALLPTPTAVAIKRRLDAVARSPQQPVPHDPITAALSAAATRKAHIRECIAAYRGLSTPRDIWTGKPLHGDSPETPEGPTVVRLPPSPESLTAASLPTTYHDGDTRTLAQRTADQLSAWILNGRTESAITIDAHIGLLVAEESLTGESNHPAISRDRSYTLPAEAALNLIKDPAVVTAWHELRVTPHHQDNFQRKDPPPLGPSAQEYDTLSHQYLGRFPPERLRQAIWFRDGTCQVAGCTVPAENCDIDHIQPHPDGPTRGDNLQALCRRHHRIKTAGFDVLITQPGVGTHRATAETLVPHTPESLHRVINTTSASGHR